MEMADEYEIKRKFFGENQRHTHAGPNEIEVNITIRFVCVRYVQ